MYKFIEDFSIRSNNFYNFANYYVRQEFIKNGNYLNYYTMQKELKATEPYKKLMSQSSQCQLRLLDKNWKSFFVAIKDYSKNPNKYLGRPRLPKYKPKGGKHIWLLKNNHSKIKDGKLYIGIKGISHYGFKTSVTGRLISIRFVPRNDVFVLEIVYEKEIDVKTDFNYNCASIDLGVDNFVTMSNNVGLNPIIIKGKIIKSENQWYNKLRAELQSKLPKGIYWSKQLDMITRKRYQRIKNYIHHTSTYIVNYCKHNNIENVIVGINHEWKQECSMSKRANQNFVFIPYDMFIKQIQYKCLDAGINYMETEESYTSGTSFLDNEEPNKVNYNKKRRIKRGLFKSNNGILINADVNASYQIMKKVIPNAYDSYGIEGCLCPVTLYDVTKEFCK